MDAICSLVHTVTGLYSAMTKNGDIAGKLERKFESFSGASESLCSIPLFYPTLEPSLSLPITITRINSNLDLGLTARVRD